MVGLRLLFKVTSLGTFFFFFVKYRSLIFSIVLQHKYRPSHPCSSLCCLIRLGFPNVTMAPNCDLESSQEPIVQKSHPPSQLSILSESVMDSQVMYVLFHACPVALLFCTKEEYSKTGVSIRTKLVFVDNIHRRQG